MGNNDKKKNVVNLQYDFIPFNDFLYEPTWKVTHDMPLSEQSYIGKIKLHIVACSPIIVRHDERMENINGEYFIPGASLKGSIRNILEIISFSKLHTQYNEYFELQQKNADKNDLAEYIFGYVNKKRSLKGRVQFGHAFCINKKRVRELGSKTLLLGNPFYNTETKDRALHLYCDGGKGKGWKRYPVKGTFTEPESVLQTATTTTFKAINNAEFVSEINYFNLNEIELGALLCALTFDNHAECLHQIGGGKAFGYGRVSIQILNFEEKSIERFIRVFKNNILQLKQINDSVMNAFDTRLATLESWASIGNIMSKNVILTHLQENIDARLYDLARMWVKRLSSVNAQEAESYNDSLNLLIDADKLQAEDDILRMLKKANVILKMQSISERIKDIGDLLLAREIEGLEKVFNDLKSSGNTDKKYYENFYLKLKEYKEENIGRLDGFMGRLNKLIGEVASCSVQLTDGPKTLKERIQHVNKIGTLVGNLKKWRKESDETSISENDFALIRERLLEIYTSTKIKDIEKLKKSKERKELDVILGENMIDKWFDEFEH